ncbi:MAG: riboflavin biosynthesis protein RibF, riboflavin kinase / FMN adenylyltransferase [Candidatus Peregrinibacteria bacterium GW2011_GWF2_33_10]|nr:MAG: riboflavin biosynthesis protein RibF, riboflavin kinase / FMN adenylyltransferase [Candidatus Peregrinibacteria bacterium GW2011_GWF2_33_10]OGJ45153.1 MAG: hypothetical protein A2263_05380 [Candidatus Peregrinibacteria bacterium RIFOXYA2_FULL_33_21]OGJ46301.1 MAG: hypothetical protein A2272_03410 [Candidatus Peregrinibacteria bacterium RIFOXYA12_FULL_33_12]OGJ50822.1 MAG: hypothetical protein A2307_02150 [Candidatus Peregrinibacteria bacterium RIFOXYB2_FULL_33_20]
MIHFKAKVIKGQGKGREIGFPTINLAISSQKSVVSNLDFGVYACRVFLPTAHSPQPFLGAMHYGHRETLDLPESLEIYLIDFDGGDLYGQEVAVEVLKKIRDVQKFCSVKDLVEQIGKDVEEIRGMVKV